MTDEFLIFFKGFCAGFFYTFLSIAGMVLVAHTLIKENWLSGMITAFGMAVVQLIWSLVAILILHFSIHALDPTNHTLSLIGSIILFLMAVKIYRSREKPHPEKKLQTHWLLLFGSGFLLALAFPIRILGYLSIFAAVSIHNSGPFFKVVLLPVIGVFIGAFCFWLFYTLIIHHSKQALSPKALQHLHKISALILIAFSIIGLVQIYL